MSDLVKRLRSVTSHAASTKPMEATMADKTPIEWSDATWNPITGCSVISPGCTNCYAMRLAGTRMKTHPSRAGLTVDSKAGPVWNGQVRFNEQWLTQPLQWKRPRMIFVCAHADLFHEAVPDEWIDRVFAVMALAPHHKFQVLTKRSKRMREYLNQRAKDWCAALPNAFAPGTFRMSRHELIARLGNTTMEHRLLYNAILPDWPLPNVWLGVSAEDQRRADERIPDLLATPAAIRWLSAEPLLGPIDLNVAWHGEDALDGECWGDCAWCENGYPPMHNCQRGKGDWEKGRSGLDWVVAGGESGPGARPMHPDWARSLRDQCAAAGVPFLFKQWGNWQEHYDRDRDDPDWRECATVERLDQAGQWLNLAGGQGFHGERVVRVSDVGKKRAGRLLDGIEHNGFPVIGGGDA